MVELVLRSPLLSARGVRHGFTTRVGGVSVGPFATLNVAAAPGDRPDAVAENLRRIGATVGIDPARLFQTSQVHGGTTREIDASDQRAAVLEEEADALVAREPSIAIGVRVADCTPVLLFEETSGHVAAVHAGWRGVVAGIVANALATLVRGVARPRVVAAIGPCIGACCFEVGDDVAGIIADAAPGAPVVVEGRDKPHVDLRAAVRAQLGALGVAAADIDDVAGCTRCDGTRFFSFRRDGQRSGRHLAVIATAVPH